MPVRVLTRAPSTKVTLSFKPPKPTPCTWTLHRAERRRLLRASAKTIARADGERARHKAMVAAERSSFFAMTHTTVVAHLRQMDAPNPVKLAKQRARTTIEIEVRDAA